MYMKVSPKDEKLLKNIAKTAMTGKSIEATDYLADLIVKAVRSIVEKRGDDYIADVDNIKVEKKHGGSTADTSLIKGIIIDKERAQIRMPVQVKNAKIALVNSALEVKKTEVSAEIRISDAAQLQRFLSEEEKMLKEMVEQVKKAKANVLLSQKGIDDIAQHYLAKEGIYAIQRVKKSDMEKLAKATQGKIITNLSNLMSSDLGEAAFVEEKKIADDKMTFVTGCKNPKAVSILIRGGTEHIIDEVERALHDALKVVAVTIEDGEAVPGGGAVEIELALRLRRYASTVGGREQLAIEAFANAIESLPRALAENAGLDPIDAIINLRNAHEGKKKNINAGIDLSTGKTQDMIKMNVIEPMRVKSQAIESATEVATMILRIDDVIAGKSMGMPAGPPGGMGGGMPPGMPPGMM
jgi:chaperonin GroEL (HSP60 family)